MQFQKWAQAELAMEAHNGKTRLGNSEVPLVVKFADAKRKDVVANQVCMTPCLLLSSGLNVPAELIRVNLMAYVLSGGGTLIHALQVLVTWLNAKCGGILFLLYVRS